MRPLAPATCILLVVASFGRACAIQAPKRACAPLAFANVADSVVPEGSRRSRGVAKVFDKIFDKADTNKDGAVSPSEAYTLVLKIFVKLNRKAPISPPSREKVERLFRSADTDRNGMVNRDEFHRLMVLIMSRASARVATYKLFSTFVAPVLAFKSVGWLAGTELTRAVSEYVPEKFAKVLLSDTFWTAALAVLFVKTLGKIAVAVTAFFLDLANLSDSEEEE